mmetsp:Transcript_109226/g.309001  ORF Transcript_109226/g.309001 Transcript_109226/m.309001 type:complete len:436 (+) Transcript_109226:128-1435(+)
MEGLSWSNATMRKVVMPSLLKARVCVRTTHGLARTCAGPAQHCTSGLCSSDYCNGEGVGPLACYQLTCRCRPALGARFPDEVDEVVDRELAGALPVELLEEDAQVAVAVGEVELAAARVQELLPVDLPGLVRVAGPEEALPVRPPHDGGGVLQAHLHPDERLHVRVHEAHAPGDRREDLLAEAQLPAHGGEHADEALEVDALAPEAAGEVLEEDDDVAHAEGEVELPAEDAELEGGHVVLRLLAEGVEDDLDLPLHAGLGVAEALREAHDLLGAAREGRALHVGGPAEHLLELREADAVLVQRRGPAAGVVAPLRPGAEVVPHPVGREELVEEAAPVEDEDELLHADRAVAVEVEGRGVRLEGPREAVHRAQVQLGLADGALPRGARDPRHDRRARRTELVAWGHLLPHLWGLRGDPGSHRPVQCDRSTSSLQVC